jgi:hypothetical protein
MMSTGTRPSEKSQVATERILFGLLLALHAAVYVWLIFDRRVMRGHDSFLSFVNQYLFLAQAAQGAGPMLWIPYVMHGRITNFMLEDQGALLQNVLLLLGAVPEGTPMLPVYFVTLFVDDLIVLTGIWWLGRRHFQSPYTRFFVAAAVLGSGTWVNHIYFNHRLIYAIPLVLASLHDFLEDGRRWKLLLAGTLLVLQFLGQVFYMPAVILAVVILYFAVYALLFPGQARAWMTQLRPRWTDLGVLFVLGSLLIAVAFTLAQGTGEIRLHREGRNPDATVTLDTFLTFPGALNPLRYADLFLGVTPCMDFSLYGGFLAAACMVAAPFLRPTKRVFHLLICLLLCCLFSAGFLGSVAPAAYELFYPLRYFRYVTLASPIVKLLALLLAGHGFEALLERRASWTLTASSRRVRTAVLIMVVLLVAVAATVRIEDFNVARFLRTGMPGLSQRDLRGGPGLLTVAAAAGTALLLGVRFRRPEASNAWILLALLIQTADLYRWRVGLLREETRPMDDRQFAMQRIRPVPYLPRRHDDYASNERSRAFHETFMSYGAAYGANDMFQDMDPPRSRYLTTYWLASYDRVLRAYSQIPLADPAPVSAERTIGGSASEQPPSPYRKVIGAAADKIQIFSDAHEVGPDQQLADCMNRPEFRGDVLLLSPRSGGDDGTGPPDPRVLSGNERLPASYEVLQFDANRIRIRVQLPDGRKGGWLYYADCWHPEWTVRVDEKDAELRRAFLGYKAVRLDFPSSVVEFRFRSPRRLWSYRLLGCASLFVIGLTVIRLTRLFAG